MYQRFFNKHVQKLFFLKKHIVGDESNILLHSSADIWNKHIHSLGFLQAQILGDKTILDHIHQLTLSIGIFIWKRQHYFFTTLIC